MTKRVHKLAAALAAGALALTQLSAVMPEVSALDWMDALRNDQNAPTTVPAETTVTAAAETTTTRAPMNGFDLWEFLGLKSTTTTAETTTTEPETTVTTTTVSTFTTVTETSETTAASTAGIPAFTVEPSVISTETETTTTVTAASVTEATNETTTTETTAPPDEPPGFSMPDDPDMPDFSELGAIGNLTEMQTEFIARSVFKCCKNPDAYPHEMVGDVEGDRRLIDIEFEDLGYMLADPEHYDETKRSISNVIDTVLYNYKECMLADLSYGYTYRHEGNGVPAHFCGIYLRFKVPDQMYGKYYETVQEKFEAISSLADKDWTDLEKTLFFHDYIAQHYNYDYDSADYGSDGNSAHFAYGMLMEKRGVCQAYAWLYNLLLNDNGVKSYFVTALVPDPDSDPDYPDYLMNHAWNLVWIDGHYYHVDVTFDDQGTGRQPHQLPSAGVGGDWMLGYAGQVGHEQFLVSTQALLASDDQYVGSSEYWTTTIGESAYDLADSDLLDSGFWRDAKSIAVPYLGGWLVKTCPPDEPENKDKAAYMLFTREADGSYQGTQLFVEESKWEWYLRLKPGKEPKPQRMDNGSTFCMDGEIIIFTAQNGTELHFEYCKDKTNIASNMKECWLLNGYEFGLSTYNHIYGLVIEDDTLRLFTSRMPSDAPIEIDIPMSVVHERMHMATSDELPCEHDVPSSITGDFSGNGEVDVLDAVYMTRYLLSAKPSSDAETRQRMDLIPDGVIDIYDLAKLKWLLLHKK